MSNIVCGIYYIQNKINDKIYIGQSINIFKRFKEHQCGRNDNSNIHIDNAIRKYGKDNFNFGIIAKCSVEELNSLETSWILYLSNMKYTLYNKNIGGDFQYIGENNGRALLTDNDVVYIRQAYNRHELKRDVYKKFANKISKGGFDNVWNGKHYSHIMPEVFTKENKEFYKYFSSSGENSSKARFTNEEVINMRTLYETMTAKEIFEYYNEEIPFGTIRAILSGSRYTHLPIYKKQQGQWINLDK